MKSADPSIVNFLQWKRKSATAPPLTAIPEKIKVVEAPAETEIEIKNESTLEILQNPNYGSWTNFGIVEPKKLEWMKDITTKMPALKAGEVYEARFVFFL